MSDIRELILSDTESFDLELRELPKEYSWGLYDWFSYCLFISDEKKLFFTHISYFELYAPLDHVDETLEISHQKALSISKKFGLFVDSQ